VFRRGLAAGAVAVALTVPVAGAAAAEPHGARLTSVATLPAIGLKGYQNRLLPGSVDDDHGVKLGGIGSGVYPAGHGTYWMVTDRGPNGQPKVDGETRRTFPVPGFDPVIVKVRAAHGRLTVLRSVPIRTRTGAPVTGLSNQPGHDEKPYGWDGEQELAYDPNGLDTEDIVRVAGGFWLVDEYAPSLVHVGDDGRVIARYVPKGLKPTGAGYPVRETLPALFAARQQNRGFEGLAIAPGGRTLYVALQSPAENPDGKTAKASRNTRILAVDARTGRPSGEYAYRFEDVRTFDPEADGDQSEMKLSGLFATGPRTLLVDERTDDVARVYRLDLSRATDLLGGKWDDPATAPSLEALGDPAGAGVRTGAKTQVLDLSRFPSVPGKIEGVAATGPHTIVLTNDNDFGVGDFDADGRLVDTGVPSRMYTFTVR
jgi:hypothetical protein